VTPLEQAVEALAAERDIPYPDKFAFDAGQNYVAGYRAMRARLCALLAQHEGVTRG